MRKMIKVQVELLLDKQRKQLDPVNNLNDEEAKHDNINNDA